MQNDLISRSDVIKTLREWAHRSLTEEDGARLTTVVGMLENAPAVDAVPVVHGRWIGMEYDGYADGSPVYEIWECSKCREEHYGDCDTLTAYCPYCGAKMDGGRNE